jgi:hypothetical protein
MYVRFMGNTRTNDDGFKGEYPKPLNWDRIEQELNDEKSPRPAEASRGLKSCDDHRAVK